MYQIRHAAIVLSVVLPLWLTGCNKEQEAVPCDCPPLSLTKDPLEYQQEAVYPSYSRPSFDPSGSGDIVYFKGGGPDTPQLDGMWRANLAAGKERQLLPGKNFQLGLDWGRGGWIATTSLTGQILIVKATGDSLRQLTFGISHYCPKWSPDGQTMVCELDGPRPLQYGLVVISKTGQQVGPILTRPYGYPQAWSPDGKKIALIYNPSNDVYGLGQYDFATTQLSLIVPSRLNSSSAGNIYGASWLPDSRTVIWTSGQGVFKTDMQTGQTMQLRPGCESRIYLSPSVSPDGKLLIVERIDKQLIKNGTTIHGEANLWLMNLDGSNERKVAF